MQVGDRRTRRIGEILANLGVAKAFAITADAAEQIAIIEEQ
jgi:hypothetical protein